MELWPHQRKGLQDIQDAMRRRVQRIVATSPTGGGKSRMMFEVASWGKPCIFYLHRRMLLEQFAEQLTAEGFSFGTRASGWKPKPDQPIQLAMIQTDYKRTFDEEKWFPHQAEIVFVDEAHDQKGAMATKIFDHYSENGATIIGMTATPIGLGGIYDELIVAGTNTALRHCGSLLPSTTFAPNEPLARKLKPTSKGVYTEKAVENACGDMIAHGRIFENWKRYNPDALPAVGFATSVPTSLGHAKDFYKRGVGAAHIDGNDCWINGEWYLNDTAAREQLREASRCGDVKAVWNRFVLREGIDWTHLYHGILATIFGSLTSYLQAGGRVLRNHPGLDHVIFTDHGGNWWRHGSLNSDRAWHLDDTNSTILGMRESRYRDKTEAEPLCCPKCKATRERGRVCPSCGETVGRVRPRWQIQTDGKLVETAGDIHKFIPRRMANKDHDKKLWEQVYFRAKKSGKTFNQARSLFAYENDWLWPSKTFPLMPTTERDWFRKVGEVDMNRLTSVPASWGKEKQHAIDF